MFPSDVECLSSRKLMFYKYMFNLMHLKRHFQLEKQKNKKLQFALCKKV